jgi:hypothetical protein
MFLFGVSTVVALVLSVGVLAEPEKDAKTSDKDSAKTVTIKGEGKCGKCALKETESCQNVIEAKEDGKTVTYYLAKNDVSDKFHKNICQGTKKVSAKGTVKEVKGKKELTATELKVVV